MKTSVHRDLISPETYDIHADRMDEYKFNANRDDPQVPTAYSKYGLHWDLLEEMAPVAEEIFGLPLVPTYDYCRIYIPGNELHPHLDRKSCEYSLTINLRNIGPPWEFFWEGGSVTMDPGDAVAYLGREVTHWREVNPSSYVYQCFLHYVDPDGECGHKANEYMRSDADRGVLPQ